MKRTQIYLDELQDKRVTKRARAMGIAKSELIRKAVDAYLGPPEDKADKQAELEAFRAAAREAAGSIARLPPGNVYVAELRMAEGERARRELEERRK